MKCENPDHKKEAEFECEDCKTKYCVECASEMDYECDCQPAPRLIEIRKHKKR